jgi:serine/threonine-protein kinase BUR1
MTLDASLAKELLGERPPGQADSSVVTRAVHKQTKVEVALKKIILHNEKDGLPITALREIKILKKMRHPNVVSVLDMVVDRGELQHDILTADHPGEDGRATIFMVFPYMDHDLCGLLENTDFKNTHSLVKLYMKQLLEGTAYLHAVSCYMATLTAE